MAKWLDKKDIINIMYGATFLGGGGGGPLETALEILEKVAEERSLKIKLYDLDDPEVDPEGYAGMIAGLGSPVAFAENGKFGPDGLAAFEAYKEAVAKQGKEVKYLYSGEMGGFNTMAPLLGAIFSADDPEERIPFLDVDTNGRAVPELNTTLNSTHGYMPYPVGLGSLEGNRIIAYGIDDHACEDIARALCAVYGNQIGFSTWAMKRDEFKEAAVPGCITKAMIIGETLARCKSEGLDPAEELKKNGIEGKRLTNAVILKKETEIRNGFDCGVTTLKDSDTGELYKIDFQNENLVIRKEDGTAIMTVPDIITMICRDEGENNCLPLTNTSTTEGMNVDVYLLPADHKWWDDDAKSYECFIPCLKRVDYKDPQIRYKED